MVGLKTDQEVLGELVKAKAPAVGQLMDQYPGIWTLVVSRWFICLYIDILPIEVSRGAPSMMKETSGELRLPSKCIAQPNKLTALCRPQTVLRVWDCLFYEGSKVLFRVALTLIMHHQPEILRARSLPDVCQCFKQITCGAFTLDCHTFMQVRPTLAVEKLTNAGLSKLRNVNMSKTLVLISFSPSRSAENIHGTREAVRGFHQ